ncbi:hypothetical protein [Sulfurospirillum sp. 1612]|uniref:hypothetical protein n=1 Tax=Sulfurospirillum sp. 1612 TaxID=3094835 RepID=UPI002F92D55D
MAIGPIGAITYANQATPSLATKQTNFQNRLDMQNTIAAAALDDKEVEVTEIRPTEETYKIDPQNQHEKEKNQEQDKEEEQESSPKNPETKAHHDTQEVTEDVPPSPHLDIKA